MRLLLEHARLVDGTGAPPVDGASILVERDTIVAGRGHPVRHDIAVLQDRRRLSVVKGGRFVTRHLA